MFQIFWLFTPKYWGNDPNFLTSIFQMGWFNHQPVYFIHLWFHVEFPMEDDHLVTSTKLKQLPEVQSRIFSQIHQAWIMAGQPTPRPRTPLRNKCLIKGKPMVHKLLIRPYFWGGYVRALGGGTSQFRTWWNLRRILPSNKPTKTGRWWAYRALDHWKIFMETRNPNISRFVHVHQWKLTVWN